MAESMQNAVDDILECPICIETMNDTRVLPCIHTFCLNCIQEHGHDSKPGGTISCPCCRRTCPVPAGGFEELPKNILLEKLLEIRGSLVETITLHTSQLQCHNENDKNPLLVQEKSASMLSQNETDPSTMEKSSSRLCQLPCHSGEANCPPLANSYCVECESYLCSECWKRHTQQRATLSHLVLPTGCPEHPEKTLEFYCNYCKVAICITCSSSNHRRHKCCSLSDHKNELEREIETMKLKISLTETLQSEIESLKAKTLHTEKLERQIKTLKSKFTDIKILETENKELKSKIASCKKSEREEMVELERLKSKVASTQFLEPKIQSLISEVARTEEFERKTEALSWTRLQLIQHSTRMDLETAFSRLYPDTEYRMVTNSTVHPSEQLKLNRRLCRKNMCIGRYDRKLIAAKEQMEPYLSSRLVLQMEPVHNKENDSSCVGFIIVILIGIAIYLLFKR